jgi:hypothetical protein
VRERRWIVLSETGQHATLGRATDPSEEEIGHAESGLVGQGMSGWLAVTEEIYYSADVLLVMQVRELGKSKVPWMMRSLRFFG